MSKYSFDFNRFGETIAVACFVALIAYVSAYIGLLVPKREMSLASSIRVYRAAAYRLDISGIETFFYPLECIDRKLRPNYWELYEIH